MTEPSSFISEWTISVPSSSVIKGYTTFFACLSRLFFRHEYSIFVLVLQAPVSTVQTENRETAFFTVSLVIYQYMENNCLRNGIDRNALMFPLTTRAIQKQLALFCEYLGYEGISTHSFRKWYATEIYRSNGYDIALVQRLSQHSSTAVTQRYIGIEPQRIEKAIEGHAELL